MSNNQFNCLGTYRYNSALLVRANTDTAYLPSHERTREIVRRIPTRQARFERTQQQLVADPIDRDYLVDRFESDCWLNYCWQSGE